MERKESNVVNWNSKMVRSFGHSSEGNAPLRKTSEHDSVIFTGYDSPPCMNQPDGTKKESSNKLPKNLKSRKGSSSEDNFEYDLDLSMEDDGDNTDIDQHEEYRLLDDEQDVINPGKQKDLHISIDFKTSHWQISWKSNAENEVDENVLKPEGDEHADCNISCDASVSGEQEMMNKSHEEVDAGQNTVKPSNLMGAKDMDDGQTSKDVSNNTPKEETRCKHDMSSSSYSTCESNTGSGTCTCSSQSSTLSYKELKNTQKDDSSEEDSETPTEEYTSGEENGGGANDEMGGEDNVDNRNEDDANEDILMKKKELKDPSTHGSKEILSPKSREKCIKDYMSVIGTKGIQVTVSSYTTEKEDKVDSFKQKIEEQQLHKDENVNALPSKKEKKSHDDKSGKKKSSNKNEPDIEFTETTVD